MVAVYYQLRLEKATAKQKAMKRVVVIGAGPAGLAALCSLLGYKDELQFIAYETSDRIGGTWILDDPYKPTSMYSQLRTNLAKETMAYPGFPFSTDVHESFIGHKEVLEYLESFAQHFKLHDYIKFRHRVVEVDPVMNEDETRWNVTVEDCESESISTNQFDFVLVCNGHYTAPLLPNLEGQSTYTGEILHTHLYRTPLNYKDKTVLVLGAGPSGLDISVDLSPLVCKVYLSHNMETLKWGETGKIEQVAGIEKIAGDDIVLKDGTIVHADVILLATGYRYSFPFLSKKCHPVLEENDAHVSSIYKLVVDINHPSMFYIGLNKKYLPFPQFSYQAEYAVGCITGEIKPVSKEVMEQEYKQRRDMILKEFGRLQDFHDLPPWTWVSNNQLAGLSKLPVLTPNVKCLYHHTSFNRLRHVFKYKDGVYRLHEDGENFTIVSEPELPDV